MATPQEVREALVDLRTQAMVDLARAAAAEAKIPDLEARLRDAGSPEVLAELLAEVKQLRAGLTGDGRGGTSGAPAT